MRQYIDFVALAVSPLAYWETQVSSQVGLFEAGVTSGGSIYSAMASTQGGNLYVGILQLGTDGLKLLGEAFVAPTAPQGSHSLVVSSADNIHAVHNMTTTHVTVTKCNSSLVSLWKKLLRNVNTTTSAFIALKSFNAKVDSSENVYVVGQHISFNLATNINRGFVVKYDSNGNLLWQRKVQSNTAGAAVSLFSCAVDASGNVFCVGVASGTTIPLILKYDSSGTLLWQRRITLGAVGFNSCCVDASGNLYITGRLGSATPTVWLAKFDTSGNAVWVKNIVYASGSSEGFGVFYSDSESAIYLVGQAGSSTWGFVIKCDSSGDIVWQRLFRNGTTGNSFTDISVDASGNMYIAGRMAAVDILCRLPNDGSHTGTVGAFIYTTTTDFSSSAYTSYTMVTIGVTDLSGTLTESTNPTADSTTPGPTTIPTYF